MNEHADVPINPPTLPKGGGTIQSIGKGFGAVGSSGAASCEIPLPVSPGRGYAPALTLRYSSAHGNGIFGIGWTMPLATIARRTSKGVPTYTEDDLIIGPDGEVWMPERDETTGALKSRLDKDQPSYRVVRYWPRVETTFDMIEHWSSASDQPGFWRLHSADGSQHLYGKTPSSRRADPDAPSRVGEWLLEESLNAHGEHILYQYKDDGPSAQGSPDCRAQRYLSRVHYGNFTAHSQLYLWKTDGLKDVNWHFELCFDYGERSTKLTDKPGYPDPEQSSGSVRHDAFSSFAYGFELGTQRLCQQILMFHYFPDEPQMGSEPVLVRRLLLEYQDKPPSCNCLTAAHSQAYGAPDSVQNQPPLEFTYSEFEITPDARRYQPFEALSGLIQKQPYQFVDLFGEGLPGVLQRTDKSWRYRQPMRADSGDNVAYGDWQELPRIPHVDRSKPVLQSLSDLTGDGRLDWIVAQPGINGFFSLSPDGWSNFASFDAFPLEFFHPQGQLASLTGTGLSDLAMLGPRSVRLYANQRNKGFAPGTDVPRLDDEDALPLPGHSATELVAFSDLLGSGQQHLIRIRHNEVKCWPNLGHGRFGRGRVFASLDFPYEAFDTSRLLLADLDGSGATDIIYLQSDCARIFMNRCGNGLLAHVDLPWPQGVRYDRFCQVSSADLSGLGCSSLILSVPSLPAQHWRYDFVDNKPYLLKTTHNNMGASSGVSYRSSAQEWLDEKKQLLTNNKTAVSQLPFPQHLVRQQTQHDEISGNLLTQHFKYRQGFYDGIEREFRGFGLLIQTDSETNPNNAKDTGYSAPILSKTWFHTGKALDLPEDDYYAGDRAAVAWRKTLPRTYQDSEDTNAPGTDEIIDAAGESRLREMARALSGRTLRVEIFGLDDDANAAQPYSVQQHRYLVRELKALSTYQPYSRLQPLILESITYQYERIADDPRCQHTINLQWDRYGHLTHSLEVSYARRKTAADVPPFTDTWQNTWWCDAHDDAQQYYYLSETKTQFIHLDTPQGRRLGLPYRQRNNALKLSKLPIAGGLKPEAISYESMRTLNTSEEWQTKGVLTGLSVQRYKKPGEHNATFPDGEASVEALVDYLETAELNDMALRVYDKLKNDQGQMPFELKKKLSDNGYCEMPLLLPPATAQDEQKSLWSVRRGFATYAGLEGFFKVLTFKATQKHSPTDIGYDNYRCLVSTVKLPDGCCTTMSEINYRTLLPTTITDPNNIIRQAQYDAFGRVLAVTFPGKESDKTAGLKLIADYRRPDDRTIKAIELPDKGLLGAASAYFYDPFSWMGRLPDTNQQERDIRQQGAERGYLLPSGHVRASARARLKDLEENQLTAEDRMFKALIDATEREPVHDVTLQADRFYNDTEAKQIRITVSCWDGFGRPLQHKQKVEAGIALIAREDGTLKQVDGNVEVRDISRRWRISERIEYNNKGLVTRIYRPYFSNRDRYINDEALSSSSCDQQFHDPQDRIIRVINAKGDERRYTYHPWYSITEDENDTQPDEPLNKTTKEGAR
jgi:YD repeat-containing protein